MVSSSIPSLQDVGVIEKISRHKDWHEFSWLISSTGVPAQVDSERYEAAAEVAAMILLLAFSF